MNKTPSSKCHENDCDNSSNVDADTCCWNFFLCAVHNEVTNRMTQKTCMVRFAIDLDPLQLSVDSMSINHHIFTKDDWKRASSKGHAHLRLRLTTDNLDFEHLKARFPKFNQKILMLYCAQVGWGLHMMTSHQTFFINILAQTLNSMKLIGKC